MDFLTLESQIFKQKYFLYTREVLHFKLKIFTGIYQMWKQNK